MTCFDEEPEDLHWECGLQIHLQQQEIDELKERVCHLEEALRWIENIPGLTAAKARSHAAAALRKEK